jgi:hypothetical protein
MTLAAWAQKVWFEAEPVQAVAETAVDVGSAVGDGLAPGVVDNEAVASGESLTEGDGVGVAGIGEGVM